jgi:peptidoglycan/xylan/chitin deacetylase (PgdA/CDA1 family)
MIQIFVPNNNIEERKYIINIIFSEFLGLNYELKIGSTDYEIILENSKKIVFKDAFFNKYPNKLEYLKFENIPLDVKYTSNNFLVEKDIPIIYGDKSLEVTEASIFCGIDIFASSFFMLTRWEEHVNKIRDNHNRFPAYESLAYKQGFLDRPVVNEYIEMLKQIILALDAQTIFKKHTYQMVLTHDVDHIYMWDSSKKFILHLLRDIVRKKSIKEFLKSVQYYIQVKLKRENDPYDTFDYIMNLSEKLELKSHFFFMGKGLTSYDNLYDSRDISNLIKKIKKRGHHIGIHPSYNAYNNGQQFTKEKNELEKNLKTSVSYGREHYLRFELPTTWQIWEDHKMKWDSSMNYAGEDGFRCGVCYPFSTYNILSQKQLQLKEKPLIAMEANSIIKKGMTPLKMKKNTEKLMRIVKKYNGEFILLWHNSSFNTSKWKPYQSVYESLLNSSMKDKV